MLPNSLTILPQLQTTLCTRDAKTYQMEDGWIYIGKTQVSSLSAFMVSPTNVDFPQIRIK